MYILVQNLIKIEKVLQPMQSKLIYAFGHLKFLNQTTGSTQIFVRRIRLLG